MQEHVRITAIVPTYNREATVGRAVDSVLAQVYPAAEVIVVDDGSQDGTRERLLPYGERIRYLYQPNAGVSAARNRGASEARSEWIAFLDSDDCWLPGHLERMAAAIRATRGEAALYFSDMRRGSEEKGVTLWSQCGFDIEPPFELRRHAAEWVFLPTQPMMFQASVIRRDAYWEIGGLPPHMRTREDTLMFYRLGLRYPCCAVAGCGTVMMDDGTMRLTEVMDSTSIAFAHATVRFIQRAALHRQVTRSSFAQYHQRWTEWRDFLSGPSLVPPRVLSRCRSGSAAVRDDQSQHLSAMSVSVVAPTCEIRLGRRPHFAR